MIFRFKFLVAGVVQPAELYEEMRMELVHNLRPNIMDVAEAEVLGPVPAPHSGSYPVVPVTFKVDTHGYETEATVLFDLYMWLGEAKTRMVEDAVFIGLEEIFVDDERVEVPSPYKLTQPIIVI